MTIHAERFAHVLTLGASEFLKAHPPRKTRTGKDLLFRENDMRNYIKSALKIGRIAFPRDWPTLEVESRGRIDYSFVDGPLILATCEVKGPTRLSFFDPNAFGRNWTGPRFIKDVRNQFKRSQASGEHYLGLLFPSKVSELRTTAHGSSLAEVLKKLEAVVPGCVLTEAAIQENEIPTGSLTTVLIRVS